MAKKRTVRNAEIVRRGKGCRVIPGHVTIKRSLDSVRWHAVNTNATIWFPTGKPFGWKTKTVKRGTSATSGKARNPGPFRYAVYCAPNGHFAVGGSDPEVIVKR